MKFSLTGLILVSLFLGAGCGSSSEESFVFNGANNPQVIETPAPEGEATLTLESTLDLDDPVVAQTIKKKISTVKFSTFNSSGTKIFTSNPIPKSPQISVKVPSSSSQVQIDYLDPSGEIQEIWGSPIPPLELKDSEFVIRQPNPDPTANVTKVEVTGPTSFPTGIPTQFTATATYLGGFSRTVTNSASFTANGAGVMPGGLLTRSGSGRVSIVARFGGRTSATFVSEARDIPTQGAPFFADSTGRFVVNSLELGGFGGTVQMRLFSDFADGQRREVTRLASYATTPTGIITASSLGQITALDAGVTTLTGLFRGRQGSSRITVGADFFTTVFTNFQILPNTIGSMSSDFLVADLNSDGRVDIAGLPSSGNGRDFTRLAIHFGNGDGTFRNAQFVNLPFTANASAAAQLRVLQRDDSGRNPDGFVVVGKSDEARLGIVTISAFSTQTSVRTQALAVRPKQLMNALPDELIIRGQDERLYRLFLSPPPITQLQGVIPFNYPDVDADEFVEAGDGFIFHQQRARTSGTFDTPTTLRFLNGQSPTNIDGTVINPIIRASLEGGQAGSPITDVLVNSVTSKAQFSAGRDEGYEVDLATVRSFGRVSISNTFRTSSNPILTAFEFGSSRRIFDTIASGSSSPQVLGFAGRGGNLTGFPTGTFNRFEAADVTGDGTFDLISWQNGVITIIRLAATE